MPRFRLNISWKFQMPSPQKKEKKKFPPNFVKQGFGESKELRNISKGTADSKFECSCQSTSSKCALHIRIKKILTFFTIIIILYCLCSSNLNCWGAGKIFFCFEEKEFDGWKVSREEGIGNSSSVFLPPITKFGFVCLFVGICFLTPNNKSKLSDELSENAHQQVSPTNPSVQS